MRRLPLKIFVPALLSCLLCGTAPAAWSQAKSFSLPQAERLAVDLKKGMTIEEVQKLLGKPRRTSLKGDAYSSASETSGGTLQWTYTWSGGTQSDRTLQIVFAGKSAERWIVSSWDWGTGY